MIVDARNQDEVPVATSGDIVIVGGGTVGLFLAVTLAQAQKSVIVIEAGGRVADTGYNGETAESVGRRHNGVLLGRAMGLGGTSVLWGGQLAEFEEADLTRQGAKWPLAYEELRHWYGHVYDTLGITDRASMDLYRQIFGGMIEVHPGIERFFTFWLPQPNFAKLFRRELWSSPLIRVILHATVNQIAFSGDRAQAVWAANGVGRRICISGNSFVFAAGTIANCRFFLNAQCLYDVPWKFNNLVGKYFQDHLGCKVADVTILNEERFRKFFENGFVNDIKLQPKLRLTREARKRVPVGVCGFFSFDSTIRENLANIKRLIRAFKSGITFSELGSLPRDIWRLNRAFAPLIIRYISDRRVFAFFDRGLELHVQAEQVPMCTSQVRILNDMRGPDGLFRAGVDWRVDGREIDAIQQFAVEADSFLQRLGIARLRIDPLLCERDMAFAERLIDTAHQCGGLRMSATSRGGVTDSNCRVWGTRNVYVAGASVFPSSSHANCTLTALALTARLASAMGAAR
jgi:choline dehydrogenase-like flavoprotein